jgi:RND family efflux transporter MFP subunit
LATEENETVMEPETPQANKGKGWQDWAELIRDKKQYILACLVILAVFLAGAWYGAYKWGQAGRADGRRILYYVDPMNPAHTSPEPGLAPCGMKMEPIYADSQGGEMPPPFLPAGSVKITPQKQQLIGVRLGEVEKAPFSYTLRSLARVAIEETRIYRLSSYADGLIKKTYNYPTGSLVMKDEVLASYYSQETLEQVKMYLSALNQLDSIKISDQETRSGFSAANQYKIRVREIETTLKSMGMSQMQMQEIAQSRRLTQEIYLAAPVTSFVLTRNVILGQRVSIGEELFRLADLSRVWIVADIFEHEAPLVKPGIKVRATLPQRNVAVWATVTDILPDFDKVSRTLKVRLEADNPDYALRPEMFVDVEFPIQMPEAVTVPVDAVTNTGLKQTVFVERGSGYFEPRRVETGWRLGDRVEITKGLEPGERIVISGNFLVDSESRMKLAAAGFLGEVVRDPVSGVNVDESKARVAGLHSQYGGQPYYFHSEESKRQFEQNPERYLEKQARSQEAGGIAAQEKPGSMMAQCPVCGLQVDETQAKARGLTSEHQGTTYSFCRYYCNREFDKAPERYVKVASPCCAHGGQEKKEEPLIVKDPVCGLEVIREQAAAQRLKREYQGQAYYFCRDYCTQRFDQSPESFSPRMAPGHTPPPSPPGMVQPAAAGVEGSAPALAALPSGPASDKDPVCGMNVDTTASNPNKTIYQGQLYYFCSEACKEQFDLNPIGYLKQSPGTLAPAAAPLARPVAQTAPEMPKPQQGQESPVPVPDTADKGAVEAPKDQVCSQCGKALKLDPQGRFYKFTYQGKTYYTCSITCQRELSRNLKGRAASGEASPSPRKQVKPPAGKKAGAHHSPPVWPPPTLPPAASPPAPGAGE